MPNARILLYLLAAYELLDTIMVVVLEVTPVYADSSFKIALIALLEDFKKLKKIKKNKKM